MSAQERIILLLEDSPQFREIKDILKAPLSLVKNIVKCCFSSDPNQNLLKFEQELDEIKKRAAGITRARDLSSSYKVASYSSYLFAFQQFFHSSYRARQGDVLENIVYYSLKSPHLNVVKRKRDRKNLIKKHFKLEKNRVPYDVDFIAERFKSELIQYNVDEILLGQIRSTDITGGTTAKGSLVDLLRFILMNIKGKNFPLTKYLIVVWEPLEEQQKQALINKIWDSLSSQLGFENETNFKTNIDKGWWVPKTNLFIKLVYGINELSEEFHKFTGDPHTKEKLLFLWDSIQKWDDLWLSYAVASLELNNLVFEGFTNFQLLVEKMQKLNMEILKKDIEDYKESSIRFAEKLIKVWDEESLPVKSPADIFNYLRDLILLRMIYLKVFEYGRGYLKGFL